MTTKEAVALLERYSNYDGMGIPNLAGCKEAMRVAVDTLKESCPELRESEDERIRKAIIGIIKNSNIIDINVSEEQMLDWLEKQKEKEKYDRMMPVYDNLDSFESALAKAWRAYNDSGARTVDGCEDDYVECAHAKGFREGYLFGLEKQKEPHYTKRNALFDKYVENCDPAVMKKVSDEVDEMLEKEQKPADDKAFEEWIDDWWKHNKVNNPDSYDKGDEIQFDERGFKNFCRGIRNMYQQKPAEWSEEDEKQIAQIERIVKNAGCSRMLQEKIHNWLESLRPQPKVDWGGEDEKWFDYFERLLEFGYNKDPHHLGKLCIDGKMWLKSLRPLPHWKPSEEQMKALEDAFRKDGSDEYRKTINSLYQDLKKL